MRRRFDFYALYDKISYINYVWYLFLLNALFWLTSLPILAALFLFERTNAALLVTCLLLPLAGASIASVSYVLKHILKHQIHIITDYFSFYKRHALLLMAVWLPGTLLLLVVCWNVSVLPAGEFPLVLKGLNVLFGCAVITFMLNLSVLAAHVKLGMKELLKLCLQLAINRSWRFNANFLILMGTYIVFAQIPLYLLLIGIAVGLWLIELNNKPIERLIRNALQPTVDQKGDHSR